MESVEIGAAIPISVPALVEAGVPPHQASRIVFISELIASQADLSKRVAALEKLTAKQ